MIQNRKIMPYELNDDNIIEESKKKIKNFYNDWRSFAFKDDIINIAVGMIIAASFKNVINSMVIDIIMPILLGIGVGSHTENLFTILVDGKSGNKTYITLEDAKKDGAVTLNYGLFINVFIDLLFVSLFLYIFLKIINKIKKNVSEEIIKLEKITDKSIV